MRCEMDRKTKQNENKFFDELDVLVASTNDWPRHDPAHSLNSIRMNGSHIFCALYHRAYDFMSGSARSSKSIVLRQSPFAALEWPASLATIHLTGSCKFSFDCETKTTFISRHYLRHAYRLSLNVEYPLVHKKWKIARESIATRRNGEIAQQPN